MNAVKTLGQFITERQDDFPYSTGELTRLLSDIGIAAKIVNREVNNAGLVNILGSQGHSNVQGEEQQKLDIYANEQLIAALKAGGQVAGVGSEELEDYIPFDGWLSGNGKYVALFDPLDGSGNIDVNVSIGTIFSIYRRKSSEGAVTREDFMQPGRDIVAAGYVIYGSSTMLVYSTGNGVNGFTLDPSIGEFCLSHPDMQVPADGNTYSVNEGNFKAFPEGIKQYIEFCKEADKSTGRPYKGRYIGSFVSDLHRTLIKGGIFLYPSTTKDPQGKLRLLYECDPMAYLVENAGGRAIGADGPILDEKPGDLHQRTPMYIGSQNMVNKLEEFLVGEKAASS